MNATKLSRSAFDCKHVKSVHAWALMHPDTSRPMEMAGKIIADFSDCRSGSVCTASIYIWTGPLKQDGGTTGKASGYGYDKFSAAVSDALNRAEIKHSDMAGVGESAIRKFFESHGYTCIEVL